MALLEPIMHLEVLVPDDFVGEVLGDLNQRRAQILDVGMRGNRRCVIAELPLRSLFGYSTAVRSATEGRADFVMTFALRRGGRAQRVRSLLCPLELACPLSRPPPSGATSGPGVAESVVSPSRWYAGVSRRPPGRPGPSPGLDAESARSGRGDGSPARRQAQPARARADQRATAAGSAAWELPRSACSAPPGCMRLCTPRSPAATRQAAPAADARRLTPAFPGSGMPGSFGRVTPIFPRCAPIAAHPRR